MKKILFFVVILSLIFMGCKKDKEDKKDDEKQEEIITSEQKLIKIGLATNSVGVSDSTFIEMHYLGLLRVIEERIKDNNENVVVTLKEVTDDTEEGYLETMEYLASEGECNMVITTGSFQAINPVNVLSKKYPEVKFVITDVTADDGNNVAALLFDQYEGSFLAGVLAAKVTKTKKLGCIGGVNQNVINEFINGYKNGIEYVNSGIKVVVEYLSEPPDYSGFSNPDKGYSVAKNMYNKGVDIIYSPAGFSTTGAIKCAADMEKFIIGTDANLDYMAEGFVLTCMMKRVDNAIFDIVEKFLEDKFVGGTYIYSLNNGGISLTDMKYTKDKITDEVIIYIKTMIDKIINNEISIR